MKKSMGMAFVVCLIVSSAAWGKVGGGDITFSVKGQGDVLYSHDSHVTRAGMKCSECHYRLYKMARTQQWTMAEMSKGQSCGACHDGQKAFAVKGNCGKCHR